MADIYGNVSEKELFDTLLSFSSYCNFCEENVKDKCCVGCETGFWIATLREHFEIQGYVKN